jgi:hypothetical protein
MRHKAAIILTLMSLGGCTAATDPGNVMATVFGASPETSIDPSAPQRCDATNSHYWSYHYHHCETMTPAELDLVTLVYIQGSRDPNRPCKAAVLSSDRLDCIRRLPFVQQRLTNGQWVTQSEKDAANRVSAEHNAALDADNRYRLCWGVFGTTVDCHDRHWQDLAYQTVRGGR